MAQRTNAKKVETPPLRTAGPICVRACWTRASLVPGEAKNSWVMWAAESTQIPMQMMRLVQEIVSMVKPQKCIIPETLIMERTTLNRTSTHPMTLERRARVVAMMHRNARATLR